jgi:S-adenosylmethionine:tRNA ribosyltransferase-isomerase
MRRDDFDYELPQELIAQVPAAERGASRLLHLDGASGALVDRRFRDLEGLVGRGDVIVLNDTRVINARLAGRKATGGRVEVMVERVLGKDEVLAQVGVNHPPQPGSTLVVADAVEAKVIERNGELYRLRFEGCDDVYALLERHGSVPLPMYVSRVADERDAERYQTVYAREAGAVAAPTAGLHFDTALLRELEGRGAELAYLTLHVGAGTFQPVRSQDLAEHRMHSEWYRVPQAAVDAIERARAAGGRVLAVGTTYAEGAGVGSRGRHAPRRIRRDRPFHPAGLPVPGGRAPAHQFPSPENDAAHAGIGVRRHREYPRSRTGTLSSTATASSAMAMRC